MQEPIAGLDPPDATALFGPMGRSLLKLCKLAAIAGGLVFVALVVMSIISIVGRKLIATPVPGDVELLQVCSAFASATFFAYCHLNGGDVKVDFFTHKWAPAKVHLLDTIGSLLVGLFGALIAWRAGNSNGLLPIFPRSLRNAMTEPVNVTAPTSTPRKTSTSCA